MQILKFNEKTLKEKEEEFSHVSYPPELQELIEYQAEILIKKIPISKMAMKGFFYFAIKRVQQELKVKASEYDKLPLDVLKKGFAKTTQYLKEYMINLLKSKSESQLKMLDDIFHEIEESDKKFLESQK